MAELKCLICVCCVSAFIEYEDAQIGITANTWNVSNTYAITFQDVLTMMFIDAIWMGVLSWYVSNIMPSEFGTHKPWYFVFLPSFWISFFTGLASSATCGVIKAPAYSRILGAASVSAEIEVVPVEDVADNLKDQVTNKKCVEITNLYKEYNTATGVKVAVDGLNLTMYSGQITALLGHNGAGKTTTIAMLTGLVPPDRGTAMIENCDISTDMDDIRRNLGVCPQHDIVSEAIFVTVFFSGRE